MVTQNRTAVDKKSHVGIKSNILQMYIHAVIILFLLSINAAAATLQNTGVM